MDSQVRHYPIGFGAVQPDQRGEDRPVGLVQPRPRIAPAQHGDLVPQDQKFRVLGR
jgi:hypothetical protein